MRRLLFGLAVIAGTLFSGLGRAQDLTIVTVTRPPFSMVENGVDTGFSIDLWREVAELLGRDYTIRRVEAFGEMLELARTGEADAAVANISITANREVVMDFSQPIFEFLTNAGIGKILGHSCQCPNTPKLVVGHVITDRLAPIDAAFLRYAHSRMHIGLRIIVH